MKQTLSFRTLKTRLCQGENMQITLQKFAKTPNQREDSRLGLIKESCNNTMSTMREAKLLGWDMEKHFEK